MKNFDDFMSRFEEQQGFKDLQGSVDNAVKQSIQNADGDYTKIVEGVERYCLDMSLVHLRMYHEWLHGKW